jgi:steroid delta-isomerase-like uncharacterized protein
MQTESCDFETEMADAGTASNVVAKYYDALNLQDVETCLGLLDDDVVHDVNQGRREIGKTAFGTFMERRNAFYREHIFDIEVMVNHDGTRAAAEYTVLGIYLAGDQEMPAAAGRTYRLLGGAFFEIREGKIARVSTCYNLQDWMEQVA